MMPPVTIGSGTLKINKKASIKHREFHFDLPQIRDNLFSASLVCFVFPIRRLLEMMTGHLLRQEKLSRLLIGVISEGLVVG